MQIKVFGGGIDIGDSLREYIVNGITVLTEKYVADSTEASVFIRKDRKTFSVEFILHLSNGFFVKTDFESDDPYKAVNLALERLETRIKKHKNRLSDSHRRQKWESEGYAATDYLLERKKSNDNEEDEEHLIIAEQEKFVLFLTVSEAVAKLDLSEAPVVMFKNADNGRINIVYKRKDKHVGWIDYKDK
ncbi:MAG: ribosome-associated translation inhibitor RaiA [Holosporales bacterium]|jgi:ribosomal subunit interface protein|nr:ribosome-associated translation inhibitor RaiA [Holosporales bacterium]